MELKNKWNLLSKKKKVTTGLVGLACIVVLVGVGTTVYAQGQKQQEQSEVKKELDNATSDLVKLNKKVNSLLDEKDPNYLVKDVTNEAIQKLSEEVTASTKFDARVELDQNAYGSFDKEANKVKASMNNVQVAYNTQDAVNKLYQSKDNKVAMNGTEVNKDLAIADNLSDDSLLKTKDTYYKKDSSTPHDKTVNELIDNATVQLKQLTDAKNEVAKVYKDGKVVSTDSKLYDSAKAQVDKVKNEKAKKELSDQLAKVKSDMDKKASEEAEKAKQAQSSQQAEQVNSNNATSQAQQGATVTGNGTDSQGQGSQENATPSYTDNGSTGGGYTPSGGSGSNGGGSAQTPQAPSQPSNTGGGQGVMDQDAGNKAEQDASQMDPTKDPNSPWYKP